MNEWDEKKIDEELEALLHNMPDQDELEKRINQSINKRIRKIVFHTLTVVVAVLLIAIFLINPLLNHMFLNPYRLNQRPEQRVLNAMKDYCEIVYPYREVMGLTVKKKGFGRYELEMQVADLTEPLNSSTANVWFDINYSFYGDIVDAESILTPSVGRFSSGNTDKEDIISKISELPKSAVIYFSVSEKTPKSIEELRNMEVELQWFQVYQPNVEFQGGMNYQPRSLDKEDDNREKMTEQELLELYISNLKNIDRYIDIWSGFGLADGSNNTFYSYLDKRLTNTWRDAEKLTELTSKNYCVFGKRDEVILFLEENEFDFILIENVNLW